MPSKSAMGNHHIGSNLKRFIGALKTRDPAIYLGIAVKVLGPLTRLLDRVLQTLRVVRPPKAEIPFRCIVIVCPPRSGGTLTYQVLTHALPSVYLANIHTLFPSWGTWGIRKRNQPGRKPRSLKNHYGYTPELLDVHEGNEFFGWLDHLPQETYEEKWIPVIREKFQGLVNMLSPRSGEVAIFKNMRTYLHIAALHKAVPEIVFVRVKRNRMQVVQSSLRAYLALGTFHPVPPSLKNVEIKDPTKYAAAQIDAFEALLDEQFALLPDSAKLEILYEPFCEQPYEFINKLAYDFLKLPRGSVKACPELMKLKPSVGSKVTQSEWNRIQEAVNRAGT